MEIKNLTKHYGENTVYENFDLTVEDGRITCILGESGSGKTTLLNAVAGLISYDGEITAKKCSYVFQSPRLVPCLTVEDNLRLVCKDTGKIFEALKNLGIDDKAKEYPVRLSGGQAQRVSLARAFLYGGELMLLDEPFTALDLKLKHSVMGLFKEVWKNLKPTVLFVTHDVDEALLLSDRIIIIDGGKIKADFFNDGRDECLRLKIIDVLLDNGAV